ncbi:MAG: EpsI family protein [Deltaproteobacteria bacterium]|nr:EpsI family protein [Deltaproteobacteria bacterium]
MQNRYLVVIAIMLLTSVVVHFLSYDTYYEAEAGIRAIRNIPLEFGQWQGKDIPLDERIYEILETRSIINRAYRGKNGQEVLLSIVYYPETKVDFHAPEACLAGRGIQISKSAQTITITPNEKKVTIKLNRLIRQQGGCDELIYYFYKAGDFLGKNYIKMRMNLALNKFSRNEKNGSLIRVSSPVFGKDYKSASIILTIFIEDLYPYLKKYL